MNRSRITTLACAGALLVLAVTVGAWFRPDRRPVTERPAVNPVEMFARVASTARPIARAAYLPPWPEPMGAFRLTYYWVPSEHSRPGGRTVQLFDKRGCKPVAKVSNNFANRLRLEGSGRLADGRLLTLAGTCSCSNSPCFRAARPGHTWGTGVDERPLSPFRSVAVDPAHVAIGTKLYIPELDGLTMPGRAPYGGFVHDGCVIADDRGGGVRGQKLDLFAAKKRHYRALDRRHRLKKVTVFDGSHRCATTGTRTASRKGSI